MPGVVRKDDVHKGHASPTPNPFHKTKYVGGSPDVFVNKRNVIRAENTDKTSCGDPAAKGSPNVYVNGKKVHRKNDATGGHGSWVPNAAASASTNVYANERPAVEELTDIAVIEPVTIFGTIPREPDAGYSQNIIPRDPTDTTADGNVDAEQVDPGDVEPEICIIPQEGVRNPYDVAYEAWGGDDRRFQEVSGSGTNPLIDELWKDVGYENDWAAYSDNTDWCAVFVGAMLRRAGLDWIKTAYSLNYIGYGTEVASIQEARQGDIIVQSRGGGGHVSIYEGTIVGDRFRVLNGNAGGAAYNGGTVKFSNQPISLILYIGRPVDCENQTEHPPTPNPHG